MTLNILQFRGLLSTCTKKHWRNQVTGKIGTGWKFVYYCGPVSHLSPVSQCHPERIEDKVRSYKIILLNRLGCACLDHTSKAQTFPWPVGIYYRC